MKYVLSLLGIVLALGILCGACAAAVEVVDAWYRADTEFPEYNELWMDVAAREAAELGAHAGPQPPAGSLHIYVRNTGTSVVTLDDVRTDGISLKRAIAISKTTDKEIAGAASVYFSDLTAAEREAFRRAGSPIWWKSDPNPVPPGGFAEVTVRLRFKPEGPSSALELRLSDGSSVKTQVASEDNRPRIEGINYSAKLDSVYVYITRNPGAVDAPSKLVIDGRDVTANSVISHDPGLATDVIVTRLDKPSARASFHLFQCSYPNGGKASAAVRAWDDEPAYGIWGARPAGETELQVARDYIHEIAAHNINVQMEMIGSAGVADLLKSDDGQKLMESLGIRRMIAEPGKGRTKHPYAYFLQDEPDAKDFYVKDIPAHERVGTMIPSLVKELDEYRAVDPLTPNLVNVDMTFKPNNYYVYGQLTDIFASDPYYLPRIFQSFKENPSLIGLYSKAIFPLASATLAQSACSPKPLHIILFSTRGGRVTRFSTPAEKRIEAYYCLGVGAKGLSYWWYTPGNKAEGCGSDHPDAKALWTEIGLIGAEFRMLSPLLAQSCPANVPIKASPKLWARALLAGSDTVVLLIVNDDYACDRLGTSVKPVENAAVEVRLPSWITPGDVFEITYKGISDLKWDASGLDVSLNLEAVEITRLIVITRKTALRHRLQAVYTDGCASNAAKLSAGQGN